jgi:hypothetical protein
VIFIFVSRYHRRRRQNIQLVRTGSLETDSYDEKRLFPRMIVLDSPLSTQPSPEKGYYDRNSLMSWSQAVPEDQRELARSVNRLSDPIVLGSPTVPQPALLPPPTIARSLSGRHLRAPPDVPADLNSRAWSPISMVSFYPSVYETAPSSLPTAISHGGNSINGRSVGLPTSPRDGFKPIIALSRATSERSNASSQEWHGNVQ